MRPATHLRQDLLAWYDRHARDLPWRRHPSPYHVLLSELMCQQTRVDTVLPYFAKFTERWPRLEDLAAATEQDVVDAWAGLGYYRRARFLHRAAKAAVARGGLPANVPALRELPGIGPYTAGAIGSIAFGIPTPLVDGNVERVLSRLDDRDADPRSGPGKKALWTRAEQLVSPERPGDSNQALMELGALVCTPKRPSCERCPWTADCAGKHRAESLPRKAPKKPPTRIREVAALVRDGDRFLLARRKPGGLLGGLWEPPRASPEEGESLELAAVRAIREGVGLDARVVGALGAITHVFSHRHLTLELFEVLAEPGEPVAGTYAEARYAEPAEVALSRLGEKAVSAAKQAQPSVLLAADPSRAEYTPDVETR
ncbi:MAG: A/G-specific adenine glycosylase [Deltaproteobacteria bacterium]|nr:MAG: A/G-specific adenine glycosylase [Deltaproteobacteria bacterium]